MWRKAGEVHTSSSEVKKAEGGCYCAFWIPQATNFQRQNRKRPTLSARQRKSVFIFQVFSCGSMQFAKRREGQPPVVTSRASDDFASTENSTRYYCHHGTSPIYSCKYIDHGRSYVFASSTSRSKLENSNYIAHRCFCPID